MLPNKFWNFKASFKFSTCFLPVGFLKLSLLYQSTLIRRWCFFTCNIFSFISFPDDNNDIFGASLLISYCSFSYLILPSIVMISFHIFSKRSCLKRKGLSCEILVSFNKRKDGFAVPFFIKNHKAWFINVWRMIKLFLLKLSFVWNFHNKIVRRI